MAIADVSNAEKGWVDAHDVIQRVITESNGVVSAGSGVASGTGVTVVESGDTAFKKTVLTFTNASIAMVDATTAGSHGSLKVYTFPAGLISYQGGTTNLTIARVGTAITTTAAVVGAVGTATVGTDDDTLTDLEADLIPSTASTLTAGAGVTKGKYAVAPQVPFDGTATAKEAYLNFAIPDAGSTGNDALLVNGTITIVWSNLGDN
jgi:hypothetical protein